MKSSKLFLAVLVLALIGATATVISRAKSHQRLGEPGVKTGPAADPLRQRVLLPESLPGYSSEAATDAEKAMTALPPDTSFGVRIYKGTDGLWAQVTVVLMGADRSSIHKPQICMTGQGWTLDRNASRVEEIQMNRPFRYDLPVNKLVFTKQIPTADGQTQTARGIYVYWFVDATHYTASSMQWMAWWLPRDLLLNGILERWAYISYFSYCAPGEEDATYERLKRLLVASVPEYQLVPRSVK